ncbi:hypothetical protein [Pelistega suis]|uniref:Uncharacterized protein n=1 Tax=Pelistega suis TaxID=1631957 RepID=A0A849P6X5_9BURK|nr:hypothetical protein [Pelistega suis]NOL51763.1 hypothetical protein [Pelistega suis]
MFKTILSFIFALIIVALISLGVTIFSIGGYQGLDSTIAWSTLNSFLYATVHKLGVVAVALAIIFHLIPKHLPRLILTVAISAPLAIFYNYAWLAWSQDGQLLTQLYARGMSTAQIFSEILLYYGIFAALLALIGGMVTLKLTRHKNKN